MPIDPRLLEILVCPVCREPVRESAGKQGLECAACGRIYPIRDGIPVMLVDEARPRTSPEIPAGDSSAAGGAREASADPDPRESPGEP